MAMDLFLVDHLMNVKDAELISYDVIQLKSNNIIVLDVIPVQTHICPHCGRICPGYDYAAKEPRLWRHLDWGGTLVLLRYRPRRIKCPDHKVVTEAVPWAYHDSRLSKAVEEQVLWHAQTSSRHATSRIMRIDWHTTDKCIERFLQREGNGTQSSRFDGLEHIAIDETSYQKRHKYVTCVLNQDNNTIVWVGKGHGLETIRQFFEALTPEQRASIKTVSGDGAKWIDSCVKEYVPHAKRCADPFHVILWGSAALDKVRLRACRDLSKEGNKTDAKKVKGSQIALGKDSSDLTDSQKEKVEFIAKTTPELHKCYQYKERLRKILSMKGNPEEAIRALDAWITQISSSKTQEFKEFAEKISRHRQNICNSIIYGRHSARLEAINNSIKLIIRRGYGFRNTVNLTNHIKFCCSSTKIGLTYQSHHAMVAV